MKAILVRIGVDHSYGGWNAPADPNSGRFVYVPIPEKGGTSFHANCERRYDELLPALDSFAADFGLRLYDDLRMPKSLLNHAMHLDPDFEHLTYGDVGSRRGSEIRQLGSGDLLVFYAGLRSIRPTDKQLIYAVVGLFVVDEVVEASNVPTARWHENAHTRKIKRGESDIVVRAKKRQSGRLVRYLGIGEYRDRAYRVRRDVLDAWGGLSVKDGYVQRSARPPRFLDAEKFYARFLARKIPLIERNN